MLLPVDQLVGPAARMYLFPLESVTEEIVAVAESYSTVATMRFPVVLAAGKACDTVLTAPTRIPPAAGVWTNAGVAPLVLLRKLPTWTLTPLSASGKTSLAVPSTA